MPPLNKGGANTGNIAFVSQSGALCTAILDWAQSNEVGFSSLVSMGSSIDIGFGEILDKLVSDANTHSILMYIEGIRNARSLMTLIAVPPMQDKEIEIGIARYAINPDGDSCEFELLIADNVQDEGWDKN